MAEIIKRAWRSTVATVLLALSGVSPVNAELTVQGWLDFYEGKSQLPAQVAQIMATSYALGMADGLIATRVMSCPAGYIPKGDVLARTAADVLRDERQHPGISVTVAVLVALTLDGCDKGPRAQDLSR